MDANEKVLKDLRSQRAALVRLWKDRDTDEILDLLARIEALDARIAELYALPEPAVTTPRSN
jgi:hypothetical protein